MYKCERCGKEVFERFGSGRFCSKACANSRTHSEETKKKISESVRKNPRGIASDEYRAKLDKKTLCPICNKAIGVRGLTKHIKSHGHLASTGNGYTLNISRRDLELYREIHTKCEICGREETAYNPKTSRVRCLAADHQHGTSNFRGVLCVRCNQSLGWFEDHREKVLKYLQDRNI